ncbi:MAG: hypothetical protein JW982_11185 [Spirochaetes bacterium]|nr:hypothetical protein [Spirochaetota bacterium]
MKMSGVKKFFPTALLIFMLMPVSVIFSKNFKYEPVSIESLSRYHEDRIAFQHIDTFTDPYLDNSIETLLIIKNLKIYLIKDGYDDINIVKEERLLLDMQRLLIDDEAMWKNRINGKLDYVKITERRQELMKNMDEEFVDKNFAAFYKTIKDAFLKKHTGVFITLMKNRKDSGLVVVRKPIFSSSMKTEEDIENKKYFTSATAKATDGRVYYCEDADGDGITETFSVTIPDGFNWGYNSGSNIIFILKNKQDDIKDIIGKLAYYSYFGTTEEEEEILKNLPKESDLLDMVNDIVPDEKFYK